MATIRIFCAGAAGAWPPGGLVIADKAFNHAQYTLCRIPNR